MTDNKVKVISVKSEKRDHFNYYVLVIIIGELGYI
jgi:hypothetical protein